MKIQEFKNIMPINSFFRHFLRMGSLKIKINRVKTLGLAIKCYLNMCLKKLKLNDVYSREIIVCEGYTTLYTFIKRGEEWK